MCGNIWFLYLDLKWGSCLKTMRYVSQLSFKPQIFLMSHQRPSLLAHVAMQFHLLGRFLYSQGIPVSLNEKCCRKLCLGKTAVSSESWTKLICASLGMMYKRTSRPWGFLYKTMCCVTCLDHLRLDVPSPPAKPESWWWVCFSLCPWWILADGVYGHCVHDSCHPQ